MQNNTKNNSETEQSQTETKQTRQQETQNKSNHLKIMFISKPPLEINTHNHKK